MEFRITGHKMRMLIFLISTFLVNIILAQDTVSKFKVRPELPNGIKINVRDKLAKEPFKNTEVKIIIDTMDVYQFITDSLGYVQRISTSVGKHNVSAVVEGYLRQIISDIVVGEGKTAYVSIGLTSINASKEIRETKKKKTKK